MDAISYKVVVALTIAGVIALQRSAAGYATGTTRVLIGYMTSIVLWSAVQELGAPLLGCKLLRERNRSWDERIKPNSAYIALALLLILNAYSGYTAIFLGLMRRHPPTIPLIFLICFGLSMLTWLRRRGYSTALLAVTLVGLVTGTRILVEWIWPFHRLDGDMLATIDIALNELADGKFPYNNYPPPMPYLPGTFLVYSLPKSFGLDLRFINVMIDAVSTLAVVYLAGRPTAQNYDWPDTLRRTEAAPMLSQLLLPCFMLHPVWVHYSVNTQYSPCLFFFCGARSYCIVSK